MISYIIFTIKQTITAVLGFIVALIFIIIPTATTDITTVIPSIERDIGLTIPDQYQVIEFTIDTLGFDTTQIVSLQFNQEDFDTLLEHVESNPTNEHGSWKKQENDYIFSNKPGFVDENRFQVQAKLISKERILKYDYQKL